MAAAIQVERTTFKVALVLNNSDKSGGTRLLFFGFVSIVSTVKEFSQTMEIMFRNNQRFVFYPFVLSYSIILGECVELVSNSHIKIGRPGGALAKKKYGPFNDIAESASSLFDSPSVGIVQEVEDALRNGTSFSLVR